MKAPISAAVAIASGILILLGYFLHVDAIINLRTIMLQWAMILAAFALLIGVINLLRVHWNKARRGKVQSVNSLALLISFLVTVIVVGISSPSGKWSVWLFNSIQLPIESSLMALLSVILIVASIRLIRRRMNAFSVTFVITAILVLIGSISYIFLPQNNPLALIQQMLVNVPAVAGTRGILIGVALGAIATGLRVLLGADRPYGG
jgi:hypothetical protein